MVFSNLPRRLHGPLSSLRYASQQSSKPYPRSGAYNRWLAQSRWLALTLETALSTVPGYRTDYNIGSIIFAGIASILSAGVFRLLLRIRHGAVVWRSALWGLLCMPLFCPIPSSSISLLCVLQRAMRCHVLNALFLGRKHHPTNLLALPCIATASWYASFAFASSGCDNACICMTLLRTARPETL